MSYFDALFNVIFFVFYTLDLILFTVYTSLFIHLMTVIVSVSLSVSYCIYSKEMFLCKFYVFGRPCTCCQESNKTGQQAKLSLSVLQPVRAFAYYIFVLGLPCLSHNICVAVSKDFLFLILPNIYMIFGVKGWMSFMYLSCPERQLSFMMKGKKAILKTLLWIKIKIVCMSQKEY